MKGVIKAPDPQAAASVPMCCGFGAGFGTVFCTALHIECVPLFVGVRPPPDGCLGCSGITLHTVWCILAPTRRTCTALALAQHCSASLHCCQHCQIALSVWLLNPTNPDHTGWQWQQQRGTVLPSFYLWVLCCLFTQHSVRTRPFCAFRVAFASFACVRARRRVAPFRRSGLMSVGMCARRDCRLLLDINSAFLPRDASSCCLRMGAVCRQTRPRPPWLEKGCALESTSVFSGLSRTESHF